MRDILGCIQKLGTSFGNDGSLTQSQINKARELGISDSEMFNRLEKLQGKEHPEVSIIIPVWNGEKYIGDAIQSALNQIHDSFEIIVVDDGSTDRTLDIITKFDNITVLVKPNGGTASALNTGIRNSKGSWIHWLSADDILYPNCLQTLMKNVRSKDAIYYTNYDKIDENGSIFNEFIEPIERNNKTKQERKQELLRYFYGNGSSSLIHRLVFDKCGLFDESLPYFEDYEFWLRCVCKYDVDMILIPEKTLKYRVHGGQMTNKVDNSLAEKLKTKYFNCELYDKL